MKALNANAKAKLNEVYNVYGENTMIAYEAYLDALLAEGYTGVEFNALAETVNNMAEMSKLTAYAAHHASCIIKENEAFDAEFNAEVVTVKYPELHDAMTAIEDGEKLQDVKERLFGHLAVATGKIGYDYNVTFDLSAYNVNTHRVLNKAALTGRKAIFTNCLREAIKG